jgi:hypothetical protein
MLHPQQVERNWQIGSDWIGAQTVCFAASLEAVSHKANGGECLLVDIRERQAATTRVEQLVHYYFYTNETEDSTNH